MAEPVTAVEAWRERRRWTRILALIVLGLVFLLRLAVIVVGGLILLRLASNDTQVYASDADHFKYGSIGAEPSSGFPYWIWKALPRLYPDVFQDRQDYAAFGFLYEADEDGRQKDLPIGISKRTYRSVDIVWLNCATCHTGTWRSTPDARPQAVLAMPSNNLDFHRFVAFVMRLAVDDRLAPHRLFPIMEEAGADFDWIDKLIWRVGVLPRFREGLLNTRAALLPLLEQQPSWGPGRVDTFNPYKLIEFEVPAERLTPEEKIGVADLPAVFNQRPRHGMNLHWDGNNADLPERNLSAAIGAGVTPETVDHDAIERVAEWLGELKPPPSPHRPNPAAVERGKALYLAECSSCHGWQDGNDYTLFEGERLGQVEPIADLGTDPARLDSYTEWFRQRQLNELFAGTPYRFRHFKKTDGYANLPLDGLWLRAPYLHNGSVPTLADLLEPPERRPAAFIRGLDLVDRERGGFIAPPCTPGEAIPVGMCFDTTLPGNSAGGHVYGANLSAAEKGDLLAYLLTF